MAFANNIYTGLYNWAGKKLLKSQFRTNTYTNPLSSGIWFNENKPKWIEMSTPEHYESVARHNPIVKAVIGLLATAASNGRKCIVDAKTGEEIDFFEDEVTRKIKKLLIDRPNPYQSGKEFAEQGAFYLNVFGNRYVNLVMPVGFDFDIMNIEAMHNLPSQFIQVKTTGKIYDQYKLDGIITDYARTNVVPVEHYEPSQVLHFNTVNFSSEEAGVMGISKLEVLKKPVTNIQACFEAMNSILTSRGMQGIISAGTKDGMGTITSLSDPDKKEVEKTFKEDYGLLNGQNPFLISPVPLNYIKTVMSASEMGIYDEFASNSAMVANEFKVSPALVKTYIQGETYANQEQQIKSLYQDAVIPSMEDQDVYWNYRLNLDKYGLRLTTKWDHIPALSENKKDAASVLSLNTSSAEKAYNQNLITVNQYLQLMGLPSITGGDMIKADYDKKVNPQSETESTQNEE